MLSVVLNVQVSDRACAKASCRRHPRVADGVSAGARARHNRSLIVAMQLVTK